MSFKQNIIEKAKSLKNQVLILPESLDRRTLEATEIVLKEKICDKVILTGDPNLISAKANEYNVKLGSAVEIIIPEKHENFEQYVTDLVELRKHKNMNIEQAQESIKNPLFFSAMHLKHKNCSAMVAGAVNTTANVLRPAIWIVGPAPNTSVISSCFVMESPEKSWGHDGLMIFSDCGIIPRPSAEELAEIAISSAQSCRNFLNTSPIISMLSFSTKGSASHKEVDNVKAALDIVKSKAPDLVIDGELQMDAAVSPRIAASKAPDSPTAGKSNTFIFPDLNSGNIAYKTAQQFGNMNAFGPLIQGLAAPINDLSRGCNTQEIVATCAISLCQGVN